MVNIVYPGTVPADVEAMANMAIRKDVTLEATRIIAGKYPLWNRTDFSQFSMIDAISVCVYRQFIEDLGIDPKAAVKPATADPERVRELFNRFIVFSRNLGGSFTYNGLDDIEG